MKKVIASLIQISNELDQRGHFTYADALTNISKRLAQWDPSMSNDPRAPWNQADPPSTDDAWHSAEAIAQQVKAILPPDFNPQDPRYDSDNGYAGELYHQILSIVGTDLYVGRGYSISADDVIADDITNMIYEQGPQSIDANHIFSYLQSKMEEVPEEEEYDPY